MLRIILILTFSIFCQLTLAGEESPASVYFLSADKTQFSYPVSPGINRLEKIKLIQIIIPRVINPRLIPLAFSVYHKSPTGKKEYLGAFALFPADNPGTFLIPAQGKLQADSEIIITLSPSMEMENAEKSLFHVEFSTIELIER